MLTREELAAEVTKLTGSPELGDKLRESWGALLKPAAALGRLCFAPNQGQQVRFTRPDTWLGGWHEHDPDQALLQAIRRFLAASGPVTREDVSRWWGVPSPSPGPEAHRAPRRRGDRGRRRRHPRLPARRRRGGAARRGPVPVGAAAAGLRPVRHHRHPAGRPPATRPVRGPDLPAAGLAVAGAAGRWPHGRRLAVGGKARPPARDDRALHQAAGLGAARRRGRGRATGGLDRRPARARLGGGPVATPGPAGRPPAATGWTA